MSDNGCVCEGNWRELVAEYDPYIGCVFVDKSGDEWRLFGLVHADDDYCFGLSREGHFALVTCAGTLADLGYDLAPGQTPRHVRGADGKALLPIETRRVCEVLKRMRTQIEGEAEVGETNYADAYADLWGDGSIGPDQLHHMRSLAKTDSFHALQYAERLEAFLDDLLGNDFFGTEGQCDPRGDGRDGRWSMAHVQGIDD